MAHPTAYITTRSYAPGNVTQAVTPGHTIDSQYNCSGTAVDRDDDDRHSVNVATSALTNYTAPGQIAPNGLGQLAANALYNNPSFSSTGTAAYTTYDAYGRINFAYPPQGAAQNAKTYYADSYGIPWNIAATTQMPAGSYYKLKIQTQTLDGLGRTVSVQTTANSSANPGTMASISEVDMAYLPFAFPTYSPPRNRGSAHNLCSIPSHGKTKCTWASTPCSGSGRAPPARPLYCIGMRHFCLFCALLAARPSLAAPGPEQYRARRAELSQKLHDGVLVLFGGAEKGEENIRTGFFQESNFYYLTGWREPGAILLVTPPQDDKPYAVLFLPRRHPDQEKWTGRKAGPEDANIGSLTGFDTVLPTENFENELRKQLDRYAGIYTIGEQSVAQLKALAPMRDISSAGPMIARLRMHKSPEELALIQRSIDVTLEAHRAAWKLAAPGEYEYQVAATMSAVYFDAGCERHAYAPIVGSGPNSTILHYSRNSRRMDRGELLLMDVGAECAGYAADITRTIPVGAPFTKRQREIYEIVLGAQNAVIAAIKPGLPFGDLTKIAREYINTHGKDLHGEPLGKYFTHGVSHHVGLDVHDATDFGQPLAEGNVITVEPGIYIPEESIGIRIEDMMQVTKDGAKLMSGALPRDPGEIEKALGR